MSRVSLRCTVRMLRRALAGLALSGVLLPAQAMDLMAAYRLALEQDPVYRGAQAQFLAGQEKMPQGRAGLLPVLGFAANTAWNEADFSNAANNRNYNSHGHSLSLTQPVFRWQNWVAYEQSRYQVVQAEVSRVLSEQDLILRVAQAYFDVVYATEHLQAVEANKAAIVQQLALAQKSFEVGTATITDTHEAQARHDLVLAQEIAAQSELEVRRRALEALTAAFPEKVSVPAKALELTSPQPATLGEWLQAAAEDALSVQAQQAALAIAEREVEKQRAGHFPTVDAVISQAQNKTLFGGAMVESDVRTLGVQLNVPLFSGGSVLSRQKEAAANRQVAHAALEAARRQAQLAARQSFLGVVNGLAQVRALRAALSSSQLALEANKLGYEVGVRINIDVLNAENQVYVTRRDLAKATLETLMAQLRLRAAVGALSAEDLQKVNDWLVAAAQ